MSDYSYTVDEQICYTYARIQRPYEYKSNHEFVEIMMEKLGETKKWFKDASFSWNGQSSSEFWETISRRGFAYSFNMLKIGELLNADT